MSTASPPRGADLDALLASRLRRTLSDGVLDERRATVVFDDGFSQWTVELDRGRGRVRRGAALRPTLVVRGQATVLADVVAGKASGVQAFLDGDVTIRGDLGLSLQLDGLFGGAERPEQFPRARVAKVMGIRTSYLEAGPQDGNVSHHYSSPGSHTVTVTVVSVACDGTGTQTGTSTSTVTQAS